MSQLVNMPVVALEALACLSALKRKVLWLSSWMVHNTKHLRPARDGLKGATKPRAPRSRRR